MTPAIRASAPTTLSLSVPGAAISGAGADEGVGVLAGSLVGVGLVIGVGIVVLVVFILVFCHYPNAGHCAFNVLKAFV